MQTRAPDTLFRYRTACSRRSLRFRSYAVPTAFDQLRTAKQANDSESVSLLSFYSSEGHLLDCLKDFDMVVSHFERQGHGAYDSVT